MMAMMDKKKLNLTKPVRMPLFMSKGLDAALDQRLNNKLITRNMAKSPEGLKLIGRMPEWDLALEKLAKLPKKEDLR